MFPRNHLSANTLAFTAVDLDYSTNYKHFTDILLTIIIMIRQPLGGTEHPDGGGYSPARLKHY